MSTDLPTFDGWDLLIMLGGIIIYRIIAARLDRGRRG